MIKYLLGAALVFTGWCVIDVLQHVSASLVVVDVCFAAGFLELARRLSDSDLGI